MTLKSKYALFLMALHQVVLQDMNKAFQYVHLGVKMYWISFAFLWSFTTVVMLKCISIVHQYLMRNIWFGQSLCTVVWIRYSVIIKKSGASFFHLWILNFISHNSFGKIFSLEVSHLWHKKPNMCIDGRMCHLLSKKPLNKDKTLLLFRWFSSFVKDT